MVVLSNDDDLLPLPATGTGAVVLVGRHALDTVCMGGGSAQVNPPHQVSVAEGLRAQLGDRLTVVDGVEVRLRAVPAPSSAVRDAVTGEPGLHVEHLDADGVVMLGEHSPDSQVTTGWDDALPRPTEQVRLSGELVCGGPVRLGVSGTGRWQLSVDGAEVGSVELAAEGADPGESMLRPPVWTTDVEVAEGALVEALLTVVRSAPEPGPDGGLTTLSHALASGMGVKALLAGPVPEPDEQRIAAAEAAARGADVAVVVVGLTPEQETEGADKTTLTLPGAQDAMVRAVAAAADRTVVVVNAATPVLMPWAGEVDAVLVVGLPGQEGGHAVADALLGVREPSGRLVTSWPRADGAAPAWDVTPTDLRLDYTEGTFVGYRGYHAGRADPPAHWLGEGTGYGRFAYSDMSLAGHADPSAPGPAVEVTVHNSAGRPSREVVQVYHQPAEPDQPVRLVGWAVVDVPSGGAARTTVMTDGRLWRRWDAGAGRWTLLHGGELLVARGLGDIRARVPLA